MVQTVECGPSTDASNVSVMDQDNLLEIHARVRYSLIVVIAFSALVF